MQDQPSRLDRIEAAIEANQIHNQQQFDRWQQQFDRWQQQFDDQMALNAEFRTRHEQQSDDQMALNAEFRTRHELIAQELAELKEASRVELERARIQQQNLLLISDQIQALTGLAQNFADSLRQHRSDGHGA